MRYWSYHRDARLPRSRGFHWKMPRYQRNVPIQVRMLERESWVSAVLLSYLSRWPGPRQGLCPYGMGRWSLIACKIWEFQTSHTDIQRPTPTTCKGNKHSSIRYFEKSSKTYSSLLISLRNIYQDVAEYWHCINTILCCKNFATQRQK